MSFPRFESRETQFSWGRISECLLNFNQLMGKLIPKADINKSWKPDFIRPREKVNFRRRGKKCLPIESLKSTSCGFPGNAEAYDFTGVRGQFHRKPRVLFIKGTDLQVISRLSIVKR